MDREEILRLAELSKLEFAEAELAEFEKQFDGMIKFVAQIEKAATPQEAVLPSVDLKDLRQDVPLPSLSLPDVLKNAPKSDGKHFVVPQVVE